MTESTKTEALLKEILSHLPALLQRVRKRELTEVIEEALLQGNSTPTGFLQLAALYASRWTARSERLMALRRAYAQARRPAERTALIVKALHDEDAPRRTLAAVERGYLDLDAMAERAELELHALDVRQSLSLRAAAALTTHAEEPEVINSLLELMLTQPTTMCAVACAEALHELFGRVRCTIEPDARWQKLCSFLTETARPRRILAALLRLCLRAVPELALAQVNILLTRPSLGDEFLLRQHTVVLLTERGEDPEAFAMLSTKVQIGDSSEHVRVALPAALRATGGAAAVPLLESITGVGLDADSNKRDDSPRVRAAAALALAELLGSRTAETTAVLLRVLQDADTVVYTILCDAIENLALEYRINEGEAKAFETALTLRAAQAPTTALAEPALRTLQALSMITDPELTIARSLLERPMKAEPGEIVQVHTKIDPLTFGRLLSQLSRTGFGIYAQPTKDGYRVERGGRFVFRSWRLLHELRWMNPYKRQDAVHLVGRQFPGTLRAPPSLLAEVTPTTVPGEPLASVNDGTWGPHLPTVDDLLSMPVTTDDAVWLFTTRGITEIKPPPSMTARIHARLRLSTRYAELSEMRRRALDPADPSEHTRYIEAVEELGFRILLRSQPAVKTAELALPPTIAAPFGHRLAALGAAPLAMMVDPESLGGLAHYLMSPSENTLGQLGIAAGLICAGMLFNNIRRRRQIQEDRAAIPLVIGGWGTRGKSGTERLKAALLHGQGIDVLCKTTGCEAMFIHGVPGRRPTEIFIHRPYDKATIWEQRDVLALAAKLNVSAFLWECMALSGPLVRVLSEEWMNDDIQTLTNAYPDHEDIQGPAGHDVARSIAAFIRPGGTAITTEEQMLPIVVDEAQRKDAHLITVPSYEHLLLADDLLARFPYREHPRNIALVRRLAVELGLDPDLATADMADHVVPDLGVLKSYATVRHRDRRLTFINGMSANERAGFLSNWARTGCERPVEEKPGRWVVTVVNNRYDRVARTKVFAEILVRDASAERHILIGTNLSGLRVYVNQALTQLLQELHLFRSGDHEEQGPTLLRVRCERQRHRLRIGPAEPEAVLKELSGWLGGSNVEAHREVVREALVAAAAWADEGDSLESIQLKLQALPLKDGLNSLRPELGEDLSRYVLRSIARRALLASLERAAERALHDHAAQEPVTERQDRIYRELFLELLVSVDDPGASGDQVIDTIARACPPGIDASVMGIQNIKGTGLDFVHRFIRYEEVDNLVKRLALSDHHETRNIAAELGARSDFGMLDSALAADAVKRAARRETDPDLADYLTHTAAHLAEIADRCQSAVQEHRSNNQHPVARFFSKGLDVADAVRRRWQAESLLDALIHREISHERAALEARRLVERAKK
jgi:poly-gamma-glutamate synthase PgsB/CapB